MTPNKHFSAKLNGLLNQIEKEQGNDIIISLEATSDNSYPKMASWGSITMDIASGGGLPKGRALEIYGWESSGKTTIAITAAIQVQRNGGIVVIIDQEHALDYGYCAKLGLDLSRVIVLQPDTAEQAINCVELFAKSDEVDLIILDSVAALAPEAELEGESGDLKVGLIARLMSQHMRKVIPMLKKNGCTAIYINQFREKIGVMYGDNKTLTGGNALKFYCTQRCEVKRRDKIDAGDQNYTGNEIEVEFKKNKLAPPFRKAYFSIIFGEGISRESEIINACFDLELIVKSNTGPTPNFETPVWSGPLESTEAKVLEKLKTPEYQDIYFELQQRLEAKLGNLTAEEFDAAILPLHTKYEKINEDYKTFMEKASFYSGKSKYLESKFYLEQALKARPLDKEAPKKLKIMDQKIKEKLFAFSGDVEFDEYIMTVENGQILNVNLKQE